MKTTWICTMFLIAALGPTAVSGDEPGVPEPFRGHDPASGYRIAYDDLDVLLKNAVVDVGRSNREKADPARATTGTRMKNKTNRATVNEGNRFRYEAFAKSDELKSLLSGIRTSLASVPGQAPLALFSREEQLAYWLNLYNVTLLDEIVARYPQKSLKKLLTGRNALLSEKILEVAGVKLSLNDIQHGILRHNYDGNPLVVYGLYQGVIGGPNIRKRAYTGEQVFRQLNDNASEFVNSNRGTEKGRKGVFRVSRFYERNADYFPDFQADLEAHLMALIEGDERSALASATRLKPDIDDWSITDLYGTYRDVGASFATNRAALIDSIQATTMVDSQIISTNYSDTSGNIIAHAPGPSRFDPELTARLQELRLKEEAAFIEKGGIVTVEELGQAPGSEPSAENPERD